MIFIISYIILSVLFLIFNYGAHLDEKINLVGADGNPTSTGTLLSFHEKIDLVDA
jgi:hypothetical protein